MDRQQVVVVGNEWRAEAAQTRAFRQRKLTARQVASCLRGDRLKAKPSTHIPERQKDEDQRHFVTSRAASARRRLIWRMQRLEEGDERRRLGGTQVLAVGRHVAAALDDLADELILRQAHGHVVERGPRSPPAVAERMAVAALLGLEHERALPLERRACRSSRCSGIGSPLHASMCGLQGA